MADTCRAGAGEGKQIGTGMLDRAKRAPPPAAAERSAKKPCCHRDPSGGGVPEISSLLSSLSVAKRRSPAAAAHDHAPLNKRPRYDHHHDLDARMRGLDIGCETTEDMEQERPDWAGFLPELLGLVCGRLPLADVPRFGAVCRHWRSCAFPVYPADAAPVLLSATLTAAGAVRCYSPHLHRTFLLAAPPLPQGGRLFSAGAGRWKSVEEHSSFRMSCCCSPVMHKGMLYCLGQEGALGVYNPGEATWSALPKPAGFAPELAYKNCHLVGSRSELLAVLTGSNGAPPIYVLRLDEAKMAWKRVKSLDGRSLFTGTTTSSVAVAKPVAESMADKVYLPRLYGRPQVIQAELAASDGRLFFVAKAAEQEQQGSVTASGGGGPWCYDMESGSGGQFLGSKTLLQSFWSHLGGATSPSPSPLPSPLPDEDDDDDDDDGMVID